MKKKTKIVATIGPASASREVLHQLMQEGVNVCRINFSHGSHAEHKEIIETIRDINKTEGLNTAILGDLQGPKIRIGEVENGAVDIATDSEVEIITGNGAEVGNSKVLYINYASFPKDVQVGERILLDDGKFELQAVETDNEQRVTAKVIHGGSLSSKKGVNLPNTKLSTPSLTEKDKEDLEFALENDLDWIGLSFVRTGKDVADLKKIIEASGKHAKVVAKIEKPEAVKDIDNIVVEADALMVARGDLGVEIPMQDVPLLQKELVNKALGEGIPVIIATQMMESMIDNISPTRAEVNDVANAVLDGADAVMLSGETSVGKHPVKVIQAVNDIVVKMETFDGIYHREVPPGEEVDDARFITDSICYQSCRLADRTKANAIITMTFSGYTAFKISSYRPDSGIYVFTGNPKILNQLSLVWGVHCFYYDKFVSTDHTISDIKFILKKDGFLREGDLAINIASMPITDKGMTNMMKLSYVD